ncbi:TPA: ParB/RepB/Spo0J family partition protein [Streptococcus suis]|nr:ParB/RepB/Spo0J family partition protein [Streptococcus suis]HEL1988773.1 ParB/RepB/Spo0J family partition protein [Streptococcus suis]
MKKQDFKVLKTKDLYPFPDNPFHVVEDETLSELAESIKEFGIVTPIITRPKEDGNGYEVIAGQRRVRASELAGINTVPAFVLPLDRDRAIITLVDSNLQRENILPSERAFAYRMKSEAMKRQGFRTDLTSSQVVTKLRTDDKVAQGFGVGRMTVQRFIRLTELIPPILQMVDEGKIALTPAVELSFLKKDEQENLFATMESEEATPSLSQAQRMKSMSQSGQLDMDMIFSIMTEEKGNQKETLKINTSKLKKYFPKDTTPKQMEETIIRLLERELQKSEQGQPLTFFFREVNAGIWNRRKTEF